MVKIFKTLLLNKDSYKPLLQWKIQVAAVVQLLSVGSDMIILSLAATSSHSIALHFMRIVMLLALTTETGLRANLFRYYLSTASLTSSSGIGSRTFLLLILVVICETYSLISCSSVSQLFNFSSFMLLLISVVSRMTYFRLLSEPFVHAGAITQMYTYQSMLFVIGFLYTTVISIFVHHVPMSFINNESGLLARFFVQNFFEPTLLVSY